jgi:thioesterase domain-containing protein
MITDWHAPFLHPDTHKTTRHVLRQKWRRLLREGLPYLAGILRNMPWRVKARYLGLKRRFELRALKKASQNGQPLSKALQTRDYLERAYQSMHGYTYRPYDGAVLVLRGDNDPDFFGIAADAGWGELLPNARFAQVPGYGVALMQEPDVEHVAAHILHAPDP